MRTKTLTRLPQCALVAALLAAASASNAQTLMTNLIFYAPFASSLDDVAGGRTGNNFNGPTLHASGGIGAGGGYVELQNDGVSPSQCVWYSDPTPATGDFSIQIWVRSTDSSSPQNGQLDPDLALMANKDWAAGGNVGWVVAREDGAADGDKFQWNMNTSGGSRKDFDPRNASSVVFDGNWNQIVVTHQRSGNATFYRDGVLMGTVSISANNNQSIRPALGVWVTNNVLVLGQDASFLYWHDHASPSSYNGDLDEAAMWSRVLTAEDVAVAYQKGISGKGLADALAPVFVQQPQGGTRYASDSFRLSCLVADDRGPLTYQWYKGTTPVSYATNRTALITSLTAGVANCTVVVNDGVGSITSAPAVLTVLSSAKITNGIAVYLPFDDNLTGQAGTTINGAPIGNGALERYAPGAIGRAADFQNDGNDGLPSDWAASLGDIEWIYTNNWSFSLWVNTTNTNDGATIGNKDWNSGGNVGWLITANRANNNALNSTAAGGPRRDIGGANLHDGLWHNVVAVFNRDANTIYYYVDGSLRASTGLSATGWESLTPTTFSPNDTLVGSSGNGRWSGWALVDDVGLWTRNLTPDEILAIYAEGLKGNPLTKAVAGSAVKPTISTPPQSVTQLEGYPTSFAVAAAGTEPLRYQWRKDNVNLAGETTNTLSLPVVCGSDAGAYTVVVSNQFGVITSTPPATLTVVSASGKLTNGLVVYLNFDNNILGQAGTTNNGTPIGDVGVEKYTNGIIGSAAARFDNDDSDLARASDWAVSLGDIEWIYTNNWSFSVWVRTTDTYGALLGNKNWYSGGNIGWCISEYYTDWLNYTAVDSPRHDIGNLNWADGKWHNVAAVFYRDGNRVYTFVDGVVTAQAALSATGFESLTPTDIMTTLVGSSGNTADSGYGDVDDLGMWARPLNPQDVLCIYQAGLKGTALPQAVAPLPPLSVRLAGTDVVLTYPSWAKCYTLEATTNLTALSWTPAGVSPTIVNGTNAVVSLPAPTGYKFLRLRR